MNKYLIAAMAIAIGLTPVKASEDLARDPNYLGKVLSDYSRNPPPVEEANPYRGNWTTFSSVDKDGGGISTSIGPNGHSCFTFHAGAISNTDCR